MFKSIRSKLILSYFLVTIASLAATGFFFQWRMKQILDENIVRETLAQSYVAAGTISSLAEGTENFIWEAGNLAERYSDSSEKSLEVYSAEGFLIADSREPGIGYLDPGYENLNTLFPPEQDAQAKSVKWEEKFPDGRVIKHFTWPLENPDRYYHDIISDHRFAGAVDISMSFAKSPPKDLSEEDVEAIDLIGTSITDLYTRKGKDAYSLSNFFWEWVVSENELPEHRYRVRLYSKERTIAAALDFLNDEQRKKLIVEKRLVWFDTSGGERTLSAAVPVIEHATGTKLGYVVLTTSLKTIDNTYAELREVLIYTIAVMIALTILISLLFARTIVQPLENIKEATAGIAGGDFSKRVVYKGQDEIRSLADTLNYMAGQIEANIGEITGEKNKINALLTALPDGVIALSPTAKILFLNKSAANFINTTIKKAIGNNLFSLWDEPEVKEFFESGKEIQALLSKEIPIPPRILKLYLIPYGDQEPNPSGMMLIIRDITDIRRLEETRTQFLGSISHELRTPLTVIKGFVHTVIDEDPIKNNTEASHALNVIDSETDRLTRLVNDLLELSRLRSKKLSMEFETLNIEHLVEETVTQLKQNADRMGIVLDIYNLSQGITLSVDRDRMKQVIINLVDNAIKYTPGGGTVTVRTRKKDNWWIMEVEDTGMGIAKDELPFLFERFFRTNDKSKRKYIKGTGLGMAIVKEIIDAHGGNIDVESREGKGTKIFVHIPIEREEQDETDTSEIQQG